MTSNDIDTLNRALADLTTVSSLLFESEDGGPCRVTLILTRDSELIAGAAESLCITFNGVSSLALRDFGGGITQVQCLRCKDIRDLQLDRTNYELQDLENGSITFRCRSFEPG